MLESKQRSAHARKAQKAIDPALALIEESWEKREMVSVSRMAEVCFLSESHFRRLFTEVMEESPKNYLMRCKMERAAALLKEGELTVTEIALRCGFQSHSTFYREFCKYYGCNPSEYRIKIYWQSRSSG